ncbi:DUF2721 domain-containing protein [Alteromonas sp. 5E99-2]|uniref:DUF2721 domain-containing protein n=1 Tax=Alteromonas sp. 5E99-2 TaxID=2817683 RepID=UPI001A986DD8|nr:DUF2721 domain-containing protein [Alteromonas sp. 5E99-2]MBO1254280.1 DUF2721 domain-containing protein [Alteromonas sp. 5E99-2]
MVTPGDEQTVVQLIQIALTPVFLIVGVGTMLNVVTGRVARIIDRLRWFEEHIEDATLELTPRKRREIRSLGKRLRLANWAINFLTAAAVVVCSTIIVILLSGKATADLDTAILVLFFTAIGFITGGLIAFFAEVSVATATLKLPSTLR